MHFTPEISTPLYYILRSPLSQRVPEHIREVRRGRRNGREEEKEGGKGGVS
jgi:hypothetical protein